MTDEELAEIVKEYRYDDRSHMGEVLTELAREKVLRKKAEANFAFMVAKAADQSLDGYRELGQRCAQLEAERAAAEARLAGYQSAPAHMAVTVLKGRLDKAEARLSKCKFCSQDVAEGAGGHTSGCYERKLNKVRACLEIDDCTAMTDAIEEILNE